MQLIVLVVIEVSSSVAFHIARVYIYQANNRIADIIILGMLYHPIQNQPCCTEDTTESGILP